MEKALSGEAVDHVPVATWRHFPGDDQRAADLAHATVAFQNTFDWDFVKVTPASTYCVVDYGIKDDWQGQLDGDRICTGRVVTRSLEWTELRPLNPMRGELGKHVEALRLINQQFADDVPILATIYSPLSQAVKLSGFDLFIRNMRNHQDRFRTGLNILTETTLRFLDAIKQTSIAGIFYIIQNASYVVMSEAEYAEFGVPYDLKILNSLPNKWWLNVVSMQCNAPMFQLVCNYPVDALHWNSTDSRPDLDKGKAQFNGAVCGGVSAQHHLHLATPTIVRSIARDAINSVGERRFILTAGDTIPVTTPLSNLRALREAVTQSGAP